MLMIMIILFFVPPPPLTVKDFCSVTECTDFSTLEPMLK